MDRMSSNSSAALRSSAGQDPHLGPGWAAAAHRADSPCKGVGPAPAQRRSMSDLAEPGILLARVEQPEAATGRTCCSYGPGSLRFCKGACRESVRVSQQTHCQSAVATLAHLVDDGLGLVGEARAHCERNFANTGAGAAAMRAPPQHEQQEDDSAFLAVIRFWNKGRPACCAVDNRQDCRTKETQRAGPFTSTCARRKPALSPQQAAAPVWRYKARVPAQLLRSALELETAASVTSGHERTCRHLRSARTGAAAGAPSRSQRRLGRYVAVHLCVRRGFALLDGALVALAVPGVAA